MKLLNLNFKRENSYPFFLLFFPIIIDFMNGYLSGSTGEGESLIGIIYRGTIVGVSCLYLFRNPFSKYILLIFILVYTLLAYQILAGYFSIFEISSLIKILYIFSVLSILLGSRYFSNIYYVINCAIGYGVVASLILIYSFVFNVGYSSYVEGTFGTKGFFIAMNDVGLTILLLNALSCFCYLKTKKISYLIAITIISVGTAFVGSMACYFGTGFILFAFFLNIIFNPKDFKSSSKQKIIAIIIMFVVLSVVVNSIVIIIIDDPFLSRKYDNLMEVFTAMSGRDYLIDAGITVFKDYSLFDWLFGTGPQYNISIQHILQWGAPKSVEVDPLDLVGNYGIIFSVMLIWFSFRIFLKIVKCLFSERDLLSYWLSIGFMLYIVHAIYGGHAYTSPLVSSYLAVFIYLFIRRKEVTDL